MKLSKSLILATCLSTGTAAAEGWNCRIQAAGDWQCFAPGYTQPEATIVEPRPPQITDPASITPSEVPVLVKKPVSEPVSEPVPQADARNSAKINTAQSSIDIDRGLNWSACATQITTAPLAVLAEPDLTHIEADSAILNREQQQVQMSGNVQIQLQDRVVYADNISYSQKADQVSTDGAAMLHSTDLRVSGDQLRYTLKTGQGQLRNAEYRLFNPAARGTADSVQLLGEGRSRYENVSFTTCPPGNNSFLLTANALELDNKTSIGTFSGAKINLWGMPVFYVPKMSIPLNNQRKSGFLLPSVGYRSRTGIDISTPYYFNLAPNYDATLTPRVLSKRGIAIGGEFRYLSASSKGEIRAEVLPYDTAYENGGARGALYINQSSTFSPNFTSAIQVSAISDDRFLKDLGGSLAVASTRFLPRMARLNYQTRNWDLFGRLQYFQTIDSSIAKEDQPYARLPQLRADMINADGPGGLKYSLLSEYVYFYRSKGLTAHRAYANPGISLPVRRDWGYIEPKITANYTVYGLNNQLPGVDSSLDRVTGTLSFDSGLFFDRQTRLFGNNVTHTLEPRLFYLYVPQQNQDDIPIFDTGQLDFNFDNLFRLNRFNGIDRIGDANQLTLALSSRILAADSGTEILKASLGQVYYFEDRKVLLPGVPVQDASSSPIFAQISGKLPGHWWYRTGVEYDANTSSKQFRQGLAQLIYRADEQHFFNASYRLRQDIVEQTDLSILWPLTDNISVIGRWNYSLLKKTTLESIAGLEYGRCCWKVRAVVRQYLDNATDDQNTSFLIQLELNGLGTLGNDIRSYLENNLYGFQNDDY